MHGYGIIAVAAFCAAAAAQTYEVAGNIVPPAQAVVSLHGATTPFVTSVLSDAAGHYRFTHIARGDYTLAVFAPGRGETRLTIDVGPGTANAKGRVEVNISLDNSRLTKANTDLVSARELSIPSRARKEYTAADKCLSKRDISGAVGHLKKAVDMAPQFSAAWNHLGTISYQTREYETAADYFKKALIADPDAYEPLVNLGGTYLSLNRIEDAWKFNVYAVLKRPNDALANSQLGMTYFAMGKFDLAEKHLQEARKLDPGHFSHPQFVLAEIYVRRSDREAAAAQLEDFLRYHPDWPTADKLRESITKLRTSLPTNSGQPAASPGRSPH